jgi:putative ABC transport system permease protein
MVTSILLHIRVALKNELGYAIGIFSLTIGLTVCLLVFRFIRAENTYDTNHPDFENIYRVTINRQLDGAEMGDAVVQFPVAWQLHTDYPGIESTLRIYRDFDVPLIRFETAKFTEERQLFVDSNFFSFFSFPLVKGDYRSALRQSNSIILTQKAASRYFKNVDPMGKTIIFKEKYPLVVTGIIDETKVKSHIKFDVIIPLSFQSGLWKEEGRSKEMEDTWFRTGPWTYIKFKDGASKTFLEKDLIAFGKKYLPEAYKSSYTFGLQSISEIHTSSHYDTEIEPNITDTYLRIFSYIVGAILLFSTVNFINLNTSILLNRAKEFSVKGILGSSRIRLFKEIFVSTLSISAISLVLAVSLSIFLQNYFNTLMEVEIESISIIEDWPLLLSSVLFIVLIAIISTIQPFMVMVSGNYMGTIYDRKGTRASARKFAVGAQIVCSFVLVLGTLVIFKQIGFLMAFDLGFNKENLIALPARQSIADHYEAFKNNIKKIGSVKNMTWTSDAPGTGGVLNYRFVPEGFEVDKPLQVPFIQIDYDFIETMNIRMKDGREFDATLPGDLGQTYIVSQAFLESVNWKNEYLGKTIRMYKPGEQLLAHSGKIIGTFEDFHIESLHAPVKPLIMALRHVRGHAGYFLVKVGSVNPETLKQIEQVWKAFEQDWPFEYKLFAQELDKLYHNERKLFLLTIILSILAIFISFFGLFGINSVSIMRKYKAIAIKKVLGAHSGTIFIEAMRTEIVFLAFVFLIAAPLGHFLVINWLTEFQYKVQISVNDFLHTVILITSLVVVTLLYHLFKMIKTNPLQHISRE